MNKTLKKALIAAAIAVGSVGLVWGILTLVRSVSREPVNVYAVSDFMTTDSWGNSSQSSGMVTTDKLQKIFLSSTQTVTEILVEEGQEIKKGDKILEYDTSLSALDVQMAQIQVERQEVTLKDLKADQERLDGLQTRKELEKALKEVNDKLAELSEKDKPNPPSSSTDLEPATPTDQGGEQEQSNPWQGSPFFPRGWGGQQPSTDNEETQLKLQLMTLNALLEDPLTPEDEEDRKQKKQDITEQIAQTELDLKLAELELKQKKAEVEDGVVYSTLDGIVKVVRSEDEAFQNSQAVVEISGGGGYYVSGVVSELDLGNLHIGDTVQINSWMTGTMCEGQIVSVEDYPSDQGGWGGGNTNVSYYPFTAFVSEDADLQENDYVDITYQSSGSQDAWYLDNMFLRTENGKSYVYVRGENGTLEQRFITTGTSLWGSYTEIRGGLSQDDYIAFPYGKDVQNGAKTQEATPDQLYGY